MKNSTNTGALMVIFAASLWGTIGFVQSFLSQSVTVCWVATGRFLVAGLFFFIACCLSRSRLTFLSKLSRKHLVLIAIGALSVSVNNFCFFFGVRETGIAIGTVATVGSSPIWAGLLSIIIEKQWPSKGWWLGVCCATLGVSWMAISQANSWFIDPIGLMSCLIAGLCYAIFSLTVAKLVQTLQPAQVMSLCFSSAFVISVIYSLCISEVPAFTFTDISILLYLGTFSTGLAFFLYSTALSKIEFNSAVALSLLEPVIAFILAVLVIGEPIQLDAVCGLVLILFGLQFVVKKEKTASN